MSRVAKFSANRGQAVKTITPGRGALLTYVKENGRTPPVSLSIHALENLATETVLNRFISYRFSSSILVPVDTFECKVFYEKTSGSRKPREGDIFVLRANGIAIASGIVDQLDMSTDPRSGTTLSITGRDLLGQWEDQDAVNLDSKIVWGKDYTVDQIVAALAVNTRIDASKLIKRDCPRKPYLAATQPGETKLSAMQRFCEALDIYFWMDGTGRMIVGRPAMYQTPSGRYFCSSISRRSNCLAMSSTRASTQIPNIIIPIWNSQETVQSENLPQKPINNDNPGPKRLRSFGHRLPKAVVVSTPQGAAPQDLSDVNALLVAKQNIGQGTTSQAGASTILQAYALREMARANLKELKVQVNILGHFNDRAEPVQVDSVYRVQYDDDDIDQDLYLYEVEYTLDEKTGPMSRLFFCSQQCLVSRVRAL